MQHNVDNLRRHHARGRALQARQQGDTIFPGGNTVPKFPAQSTQSSAAGQATAPGPVSVSPTSSPPQQTSSSAPVANNSPTSAAPTSTTPTTTAQSTSTQQTVVASAVPVSASTPTSIPAANSTPLANTPLNTANQPVVVYATSTALPSAASAAASASATASSGVSTGVIIGGAAAGVVAVLGILIGIFYFMRKRGSDEDDVLGNWNPDDARRQSQMIDDHEPTPPRVDMYGGGSSLRPPTMIERRMNNASPMLARQRSMGQQFASGPSVPAFDHNGYPIDNGGYGNNGGYAAYGAPMGYGPGPDEYNNMPPPGPVGNPFITPYEPSMPSPHDGVAPLPAAVTRQPSQSHQAGPEDDSYADLSRSSVTPYQEQQYAEINHRLNAPGLGAVTEEAGPAPPPAALVPGGRHSPTSAAIPRTTSPTQAQAKRPDTMYSAIYDEEDAYGGI